MSHSVSSRAYLITFAATFLLVVASVASLNYIVDPARLFDRQHFDERRIASMLAGGANVSGVENVNDRLLQIFRLEHVAAPQAKWVAIGSSRTMQVSSVMLNGGVINLAVTGASLEDHVALSYEALRLKPAGLLLGIDPWIFNPHSGQDLWKHIRESYEKAHAELTAGTEMFPETAWRWARLEDAGKKYKQLLNLDYTKSSLRQLSSYGAGSNRYVITSSDDPPVLGNLIRSDGSRVYYQTFEHSSTADVKAIAEAYARPPIYSLGQFSRLDQGVVSQFELLVEKRSRQMKLRIFLPPYHPVVYAVLQRDYPVVADAERLIRALAAKHEVPVIGSYDPAIANCSDAEFYDGMHPRSICVQRILACVDTSASCNVGAAGD